MEKDNREIAKAWIAFSYAEEGSEEYESLFWVYTLVDDLRHKDVERCWNIIVEIREMDESDFILAGLAAGPVEDLLVKHGDKLIDRIEERAQSDSRFRVMLGMVWRNDISEPI